MRFKILAVLALLTALPAQAGIPWQRFFQDAKFPTQAQLDHDSWALPLGSSTSQLGSGFVIGTTGTPTITVFTGSQPDYPKNILLTPTGTTANVNAGTAVVSGLNILGQSISENFTISGAQSTATTGSKAFKTVTQVTFPAASASGVTLSIGTGTKLGIRRCTADAGKYVFSEFGGAYETTRGTMASSASAVESNTFIPNGSMNGATAVDLFYIQNYACH